MRYAAATRNFPDSGLDLFGLVETFVGYGFDGLSFVPQQLLSLDASQGRELVGLLRQQRLVATIHGHFGLVPEEVAALVELLGDRLQCFTFDAAMAWDSRGHVFDAARMARLLAEVAACSRGTELKFGVEDFPLDS
jgi:sugar phosphate isomerase/epimerase